MHDERTVAERVADGVADGVSIDWARVISPLASDLERRQVENLRVLSRLVPSTAQGPSAAGFVTGRSLPNGAGFSIFCWFIAAVAVLQTVLALFGYVAGWTTGGADAIFRVGRLAALGAFTIGGTILLCGGRRDRRAIHLGIFFLIVASAFTRPFLSWIDGPLSVARHFHPDAFLPFFLWLFVLEFPRVHLFSRTDSAARVAVRVAGGVGWMLMLAGLITPFLGHGLFGSALIVLGRESLPGVYWMIVFALMAPALPVAHCRGMAAGPQERRRLFVFTIGLLAGATPIVLFVAADVLLPAIRERVAAHADIAAVLVYSSVVSIPVTTTYAVLWHHILNVRLALGRASRRLLAHRVLLAGSVLPLVLLVWHVERHSGLTVGALQADSRMRELLAASATGLLLLACRGPVQTLLDRLFFYGDPKDHARIARATAGVVVARSIEDAGQEIVSALDEICLPETPSVLVLDADTQRFVPVAGRAPSLCRQSALVFALTHDPAPAWVDAQDPDSLFHLLPEDDAHWVIDSGASAVFPIGEGDSQLGLLVIGRGHDGAPVTGNGLLAVASLATAAAAVLGRFHGGDPRAGDTAFAGAHGEDLPAAECAACASVVRATETRCPACAAQLSPAYLPAIVAGKFRVDKRLGAGGMGVVYQAHDLALDRTVAIKALPRVSPQALVRMQREARAMAAVTHPNVALIFGLETWRGRPLLVVEYLRGGTLATRLRHADLPVSEALAMGIGLASGLAQIHDAGVLHRDVKPSNIGFGAHGIPKLLDFGLAGLLAGDAPETAADVNRGGTTPTLWRTNDSTSGAQILGTPAYMAPETFCRTPPGEWMDLWSLAMVLLECIAGRHPFRGQTVEEVIACVRERRVPSLRDLRPQAPLPLVTFFDAALHADRRRRPQTACEMRQFLERVAADVLQSERAAAC